MRALWWPAPLTVAPLKGRLSGNSVVFRAIPNRAHRAKPAPLRRAPLKSKAHCMK